MLIDRNQKLDRISEGFESNPFNGDLFPRFLPTREDDSS